MDVSFFVSNLQSPLTDSIITNASLALLITLATIFSLAYGFVKFLIHGAFDKLVLEAIVLTLITLTLCLLMKLVYALSLVAIAVALMTLLSVRKRTRQRNERVKKDIGAEDVFLPPGWELTTSWEYQMAEECIKSGDGMDAINHLLRCKGKITGQPHFFISYADALMQLENYSGALAKLNSILSKRLNQRDVFINATLRKALCYHGLHKYVEELECYNALLSRNVQPGVYYFRRVQVKLRMLETATCLELVEQAIADGAGSRQDFIDGIFNDLDNLMRYNRQNDEQYEGRILSCKGACLVHAGDYQDGQKLLDNARKIDEFYPNTYVYLGICLYQEKNLTEAVGLLRKAVSHEDKPGAATEMAYYYLSKIYYEMGKYDKAIQYAAQSLSIFSPRVECFQIQGGCYINKQMYADAIRCFTKAIKLRAKAEYYASRASCYFSWNFEAEKAYRDMQDALRLNDTSDYRLEALLYKSATDNKKKIQIDKVQLEELLAPFQSNPNYFVNIGIIYYEYQYLEESRKYYRKAIEVNPKDNIVHFDLALVLNEMKLYSEAVEELNIAIELNPLDAKYYKALVECYQNMDDPIGEAEAQIRLEQVNQAHCNVNKNNGDAVYRLGKYHAAVKYYWAALSYFSTPAVLNNLACACYVQGLYEDAEKSLKKAITLDQKYYLAYFNLGNCQLRMGKNGNRRDMEEMAKENFKVSARLNAAFKQAQQMLQYMNAEMIEMVIDTEKFV